MTDSIVVPVPDASAVAAARRAAASIASAAALGEADIGRAALVTTEAASNLVKHAGGGEIVLRPMVHARGVEMLAIDRGRGMNVDACLRDGYSSAGSPGTGLGAIRRVANYVDIYSAEGAGTVLVAHVSANGTSAPSTIDLGVICVPHPLEFECGDGWTALDGAGLTTVLVVDGLGHGTAARAAATIAIETFIRRSPAAPVAVIEDVHHALRSTRGAAVAIAQLDSSAGTVRFCGIGNIRGAILGVDRERWMLSHNGTAGHSLHRIQEFEYAWPEDSVAVFHTDGVSSHWDLGRHPGLLSVRHPAIVAGLIYRDYRRSRDDATVIAARRPASRMGQP